MSWNNKTEVLEKVKRHGPLLEWASDNLKKR